METKCPEYSYQKAGKPQARHWLHWLCAKSVRLSCLTSSVHVCACLNMLATKWGLLQPL